MSHAEGAHEPRATFAFESIRRRRKALLEKRGWIVEAVGPKPDPEQLRHAPDPDVVVLGNGHRIGQEDLLLAESLQAASPEPALVLVGDLADEAHLRWAARLTPFLWPGDASPEAFAELLERVRESRAAPPRALEVAALRRVTIRLWEAVEVDGRPMGLGVAERNFLYTLARHRGLRISKEDVIDAGRGPGVASRECRRRLGKRLGSELASLLVPEERGEPYRFREPEEVTQLCAGKEPAHPATELRIIGRSSARSVGLASLDGFADDSARFS